MALQLWDASIWSTTVGEHCPLTIANTCHITSSCTAHLSLIHVHELISFVIGPLCNLYNMHQVSTMLSLAMNAGVMMTNLKAELPGYGTVSFDPQAMTNVLSFGTITKQYLI